MNHSRIDCRCHVGKISISYEGPQSYLTPDMGHAGFASVVSYVPIWTYQLPWLQSLHPQCFGCNWAILTKFAIWQNRKEAQRTRTEKRKDQGGVAQVLQAYSLPNWSTTILFMTKCLQTSQWDKATYLKSTLPRPLVQHLKELVTQRNLQRKTRNISVPVPLRVRIYRQ